MCTNRPARDLATLERLPDGTIITEQELEVLTGQSFRTWQADRVKANPRLPYLKLGRSVRYRLGDVRAYLASCRVGDRAA